MLSTKVSIRCLISVLAALYVGTVASSPMFAQSGSRGIGGAGGPAAPTRPQETRRYTPPRFAPSGPRVPVAEVRLTGNFSSSESRIRSKLATRAGRLYDPQSVQADVRQLLAGLCYDVNTYQRDTPEGVIVTFELFEQPTIQYIRFVGNKVRSKTLLKKVGLEEGQPLNRYRVEEAARKLETFYRERGNSHVSVTIEEGVKQGSQGVVFRVEEGPRQRIFRTKFEGNTIASDARLRTQIESKPGILWFFKGQVDRDQIEEDVDRLTSYYRSLGFFRAKVTRELAFDDDQEWLTLTFTIDEGPRYVIRQVSVEGNAVFKADDLLARTELSGGDFFDQARMNLDVGTLKDIYGSQGYINANIRAEPQFFEQPGQLDLVYKIDEGKQFRVGKIRVEIDGEHPHTRQSVILNRIELREGDIIDSRKLRNSERRLKASQLFENGPIGGPEIAVLPRSSNTQISDRRARNY